MEKPGGGRFLRFCIFLHLAVVVGLAIAIRVIGEKIWPLAAVMYLPQIGFGLPILLFAPILAVRGPRRLLWTQAVALFVVVFPLMGFCLGSSRAPRDPSRAMRLLTYNVWFGWGGQETLGRQVERGKADIVAMQAVDHHVADYAKEMFPGWNVAAEGDFLLATRYPVKDIRSPPELPGDPPIRAAFIAYTIETPSGPIDLVNVHPFSPRDPINVLRGRESKHGEADWNATSVFARNTSFRQRQIEAATAAAQKSTHPVIIVGDTNLPTRSWLYRKSLGAFHEAFDEVGFGFGYTFPTLRGLEWLRLDRALAGPGVRFLRCEVGGREGSDHRPLLVEFELEK
jgi:endonuclease/exonuclease/phosphatase (EEP) superfamily protein YafD